MSQRLQKIVVREVSSRTFAISHICPVKGKNRRVSHEGVNAPSSLKITHGKIDCILVLMSSLHDALHNSQSAHRKFMILQEGLHRLLQVHLHLGEAVLDKKVAIKCATWRREEAH